jgi:hypothetical protein
MNIHRTAGTLLILGLGTVSLLGCPPSPVQPPGANACPLGSTVDYSDKASSQCQGKDGVNVAAENGNIDGQCQVQGDSHFLCKAMCGACGAKEIKAGKVTCAVCSSPPASPPKP